jgi:hypothetical protein
MLDTIFINKYFTLYNMAVVQPNELFGGMSYSDWSIKWWNWAYSVPAGPSNPVRDNNGASWAANQNDPNVWYMAGTFGETGVERGRGNRRIRIPGRRGLLFPIFNCEYCRAEVGDGASFEVLSTLARADVDSVYELVFTDNGAPIVGDMAALQRFRVHSPPFTLSLPWNAELGHRPGDTQSVADGIYVIIRDLQPRSQHDIHIVGRSSSPPFCTEVTYYLEIT